MFKLPLLAVFALAATLSGRAQEADLLCQNYIGVQDALEMSSPLYPSPLVEESRAWTDLCARVGIDPQPALVTEFLDRYPGGPYTAAARMLLVQCVIADAPGEALDILDDMSASAFAPDGRGLYHYYKGYALMMTDDPQSAADEFKRALKTKRLRANANFFLGYINYTQGRYQEAMNRMRSADSHSLPGALADLYIAQMQYTAGNLSSAEAAAKAIINSPVDIPAGYRAEAMRIAGEAAFEDGRFAEASAMLRKYRETVDSPVRSAMYILGTEEFKAGKYEAAVDALESVADDNDAMGQSALLYIGQALLASGSNDAAMSAFSRAMALDFDRDVSEAAFYNYAVARTRGARMPFSSTTEMFEEFLQRFPDGRYAPLVQEYLVSGYLTDHNYEGALQSINRMHSLTPRVAAAKQQVLYALGTRALAAGNPTSALEYLDQARSLAAHDRATDARVALSRGEALYRLGRHTDAVAEFKKYLDKAPADDANRPLAHYDLGYALLAGKNYKDAAAQFNRAAASDLDVATRTDALNRLADTEFFRRMFDEALGHYAKAGEQRPSAADYPLYQQGIIYGFQGYPTRKIATLEQLVADFPGSSLVPDALLETTEAYTRTGNTAAALEVYKRLVSAYPSTEQGRRGYLQMALTRLNSGDRPGAIADYRSIVSLYPTSEEARMAVDQLKVLSAQDGTLGATAAWLETIDNAPRLDVTEADALAFSVAEDDWLNHHRTARLEKYLTEYPRGASRAAALAYLMEAAANDSRTGDALTFASEILDNYPDSRHVEGALEVKANALHDLGRGAEALEAYTALESRASSPKLRHNARMGIMRVARDLADNPKVIEMSETLLSTSATGDADRPEIEFTLARARDLSGDTSAARAIWKSLAANTDELYGAKSAVALGQSYFDSGDMEQARATADALIDSATPHTYWLARAFILLSDVYTATGQTFEAREYLLSLKDNYPGTETDIFQMINTRLSSLK